MPHEVIMPALGMAQDTGLIVAWHKGPGDRVATGDVLFEVETDKATMEVEAAADGYLDGIRFDAGAEVPVGDVIAVIGDSPKAQADAPASAPEPAAASEAPKVEGKEVIMPALGMAQDTGLIVAWHKAPGDAVSATDILFEVETDKSTMEVEAGHDGYVAALYALEGEEAPVGQPIAVISAGKPEAPVQKSRADVPATPAPEPPKEAPSPEPAPPPTPAARAPATADERPIPSPGRILASPKARRLAAEEGLDLARLAEAGRPQPYHVADLEALRALPAQDSAPHATVADQQIAARVPAAGFDGFLAWGRTETQLSSGAVWAAFAAAGLRAAGDTGPILVRATDPGRDAKPLLDPDLHPLGQAEAVEDGAPALIVRDLCESRITMTRLGAAEAPTLTVARDGDALSLTLDFAAGRLPPETAIALLDGVAARAEDPLRHLL